MQFNSFEYLIFFPIVVALYYAMPHKVRHFWLLAASYFFYMCWNARYALLLLGVTVTTYLSGILIERSRSSHAGVTAGADGGEGSAGSKGSAKASVRDKVTLIVCLVINLGVLFVFKYLNFGISLISSLMEAFHLSEPLSGFDILLPVGISFYVFQALGYLIDLYKGEIKAERDFFKFALFVSFFPQLVAGPIERSKNLLHQLTQEHSFSMEHFMRGSVRILWGLFLKMAIADRCASWVTTVYSNPIEYSAYRVILANVAFALQIYCDFRGYSTIAKGSAEILGIELMDNFRQPYFATSIRDFWRRWHISLSTWFRDYLYIPLGGSRCSRAKKYRNIMITFLLSGLWHGANLTFVVWGGLHGLYQIIEDALSPVVKKLTDRFAVRTDAFSWRLMSGIKTFILVDLAWIFFRADDLQSGWFIFKKTFYFWEYRSLFIQGVDQMGLDYRNVFILLVCLLVLLFVSILNERRQNALDWLMQQNTVFRYAIYWCLLLALLLSLDISGVEFIYFQF